MNTTHYNFESCVGVVASWLLGCSRGGGDGGGGGGGGGAVRGVVRDVVRDGVVGALDVVEGDGGDGGVVEGESCSRSSLWGVSWDLGVRWYWEPPAGKYC